VWDQVDDRFKRLDSSRGLPWEVENDGLSPYAAYRAAEGGESGSFCSLNTHAFGDTFEQALANCAGGFRREIPWRNTRTASGHYESRLRAEPNEQFANGGFVVCNDLPGDNAKILLLESGGDGGPTEIFTLAAC